MKPHTLILQTTRGGSRSPVRRWNPSVYPGQGGTKPTQGACLHVLEDRFLRTKKRDPLSSGGVDASLLLVILHYLLKNNTAFMMGMEQVTTPPEAQVKRSAGISRVAPGSHRGRWGV